MEDLHINEDILKERRIAKRRNVSTNVVLHFGTQPHAYSLWCQTCNIGLGGAYIESKMLNNSKESDLVLAFSECINKNENVEPIHADIIRCTEQGVVLKFKDLGITHKQYLSRIVR